jgi:hypothetical protein
MLGSAHELETKKIALPVLPQSHWHSFRSLFAHSLPPKPPCPCPPAPPIPPPSPPPSSLQGKATLISRLLSEFSGILFYFILVLWDFAFFHLFFCTRGCLLFSDTEKDTNLRVLKRIHLKTHLHKYIFIAQTNSYIEEIMYIYRYVCMY